MVQKSLQFQSNLETQTEPQACIFWPLYKTLAAGSAGPSRSLLISMSAL